jgi:FUS-interacting serine-arginine-rich protein 1
MCAFSELRGFGFVKFRHPEDAAYAKQEMNHQVICGREITIVFAEENRKTPQEMRFRTRSRSVYSLFYYLSIRNSRIGSRYQV